MDLSQACLIATSASTLVAIYLLFKIYSILNNQPKSTPAFTQEVANPLSIPSANTNSPIYVPEIKRLCHILDKAEDGSWTRTGKVTKLGSNTYQQAIDTPGLAVLRKDDGVIEEGVQ